MKKYIKNTIDVYDKLGAAYLSSVGNATPDEIHAFIHGLPTSAKVLDVGCAGGRDSKIFADHGFYVTGIDLCEPFLQEAQNNVPSGTFIQQDVLELDFEDAYFDGIWACAVLLHLEKKDLPQVLSDFYRLLKPNGSVFIAVKQGEGERSVVDSLSGGNSRFFSFYQLAEIEALVRAAGFTVNYSKIKDDDTGRGEVKWIRMIAEKGEERSDSL
ncbi:class I SAM-dependent methyltransferase [Patescibacteria group bacterium]|nr:class I SAM-dependent methyltransferase [Patescibacteria group bacterium]MBP9709404.1 class I SAM-dependent methyltransferase [Patescibacteria group bacterium]